MSSPMHYNFPGINDGLDSLDTMNSTASSSKRSSKPSWRTG